MTHSEARSIDERVDSDFVRCTLPGLSGVVQFLVA